MLNAVFVIEKPSLLVEAIKKIEEIFKEIRRDAEEGGQSFQDIQGDVYEMLLSEIVSFSPGCEHTVSRVLTGFAGFVSL